MFLKLSVSIIIFSVCKLSFWISDDIPVDSLLIKSSEVPLLSEIALVKSLSLGFFKIILGHFFIMFRLGSNAIILRLLPFKIVLELDPQWKPTSKNDLSLEIFRSSNWFKYLRHNCISSIYFDNPKNLLRFE